MSRLTTWWLGRVPYREALEAQRSYRELLIAGRAPEALWLLEHPPVITFGRRGGELPGGPGALRDAGYELVQTERGGLATCHEPGQLVGYLLVDVREVGIARMVAAVEDGLIGWLAGEGVAAGRREGHPGVWVGREKVAAVGLHVRLGRTMHGFALNLHNDRRGFALIVPCGVTDGGVTTLEVLTGRRRALADVAPEVGGAVARALLDARGAPR